MMDATELLLDVRNLSVRFDNPAKPPALSDVSFTLGKGEILGIVGETGAGKSLLARAIIDMLPAEARITEGEVLVNGQSISRMTDEQKRGFRGGEVALIGTNAKASSPKGMRRSAARAAGMTITLQVGIASRFATTANC